MAICHGILSIYFNHTVMLDVLRRFTNIHKVGDFHCYKDNGLVFRFHRFVSVSLSVCVSVRTAKFNTSSIALFFNAHHHRITLASRVLSLQESNQKRHFAFLCLALMMMMTKTILSYFNAIPFQSQTKSNRTAMACACVFVVGRHKTTTNTDNRFVFQVNHRNRFNELIQRNVPLFQWYFCDFLIIWRPLLPCVWSVGRVEPFLLR